MRFVKDMAAPICVAAVLCAGLLWLLITVLDLDTPELAANDQLPPAPRATPAPAREFPFEYPAAPLHETPATSASPATAAEQRQRNVTLEREVSTYQALQRNCVIATRNNANGEYPTLQKLACGRLEQFANEKGWDPKPQITEKSLTEPSTARVAAPDGGG